jgi:hypothetical protein
LRLRPARFATAAPARSLPVTALLAGIQKSNDLDVHECQFAGLAQSETELLFGRNGRS